MEHGTQQSAGRKQQSAIALLTADHRKVQKMFKDFEKMKNGDVAEKDALVQEACTELTIHARLEEEIFYPAVREAIGEEAGERALLDEAEVEHVTAKELIEQLESMAPGEELYDAKFTVLGEYVNHHIKEEQGEIFAKARKAKLDFAALGQRIAQRKQQLRAELGVTSPGEEDEPQRVTTDSTHRSAA